METMALWYSNSGRESSVIEIACNLLNTEVTSPEIVEVCARVCCVYVLESLLGSKDESV